MLLEVLQLCSDVTLIAAKSVEGLDDERITLTENGCFQCLIAWTVEAFSRLLIGHDITVSRAELSKSIELSVKILFLGADTGVVVGSVFHDNLLEKCIKKPMNFRTYPKTASGGSQTGNSSAFDVVVKVYLIG